MRPYRVEDLAGFLTGAWRIERRIADRLTHTEGRLTGTANLTPQPGGLHYAEAGALVLGAYRGPARQDHDWRLRGLAEASIHFTDGRPFHSLDLTDGRADVSHSCAPDLYRGRYRVLGRDAWSVAWLVQGPRKRLRIATRYRRL